MRDHDAAYTAQTSTPPRRRQGRPPSSPLLHTQFRSSTATTATTLDLLNKSSSSIAGDDSQDIYYDDADSVYSSATVSPQYRAGMHPTPPRSADSRYNPEPSAGRAAYQGRQPGDPFVGIPSMYTDYRPSLDGFRPAETRPQEQEYGRPRRSSDSQHVDPFAFTGMPQADSPKSVPTVVISSADTSDTRSLAASYVTPSLSSSGRTPSALPYGVNYSRPVRPSSDDNKRMVLERNGYRTPPTTGASGARTFQSMQAAPPLDPHSAGRSGPTPLSRTRSPLASPSPAAGPQEPSFAAPTSRSPSPRSPFSEPAPTSPLSPASTNSSLTQTITLSRDPPPPPTSPTGSLYSSYSYYQLETPVPSPTTDTLRVPGAPPAPPAPSLPRTALSPAPAPDTANPRTAEDYLQLGIQHHEANRLAESAACFEQSATLPGGSGVGMLMWGLALRHGWGCAKNERQGFAWLRRAAESAVDDLERARQGMDTTAIRSELVLAIYEVGQCFFQGWGVKKDQKMAVVRPVPSVCLPACLSVRARAGAHPPLLTCMRACRATFRSRRSSGTRTPSRSSRSASRTARAARRTARRPPSGTATRYVAFSPPLRDPVRSHRAHAGRPGRERRRAGVDIQGKVQVAAAAVAFAFAYCTFVYPLSRGCDLVSLSRLHTRLWIPHLALRLFLPYLRDLLVEERSARGGQSSSIMTA